MIFKKILFYLELFLERSTISYYFYPFRFNKKNTRVLVRVDDFPHRKKSFEEFLEFDKIMKKYEIPYILGVTPFLSADPFNPNNSKYKKLTKKETNFLKKATREKRILIALHGITHQTRSSKRFSEFTGKDITELEKNIIKSKKYLKTLGSNSEILMPPFNEFDRENLKIFEKHFKIITGGPENIKSFGRIFPRKMGKIFYLPSYFPTYLYPNKKISLPNRFSSMTIHWAWFTPPQIEEICKKIKPFIVNPNIFLEKIKKKPFQERI